MPKDKCRRNNGQEGHQKQQDRAFLPQLSENNRIAEAHEPNNEAHIVMRHVGKQAKCDPNGKGGACHKQPTLMRTGRMSVLEKTAETASEQEHSSTERHRRGDAMGVSNPLVEVKKVNVSQGIDNIVQRIKIADTRSFLEIRRPHAEGVIGCDGCNGRNHKCACNNKWVAYTSAKKQPMQHDGDKENVPLKSAERDQQG